MSSRIWVLDCKLKTKSSIIIKAWDRQWYQHEKWFYHGTNKLPNLAQHDTSMWATWYHKPIMQPTVYQKETILITPSPTRCQNGTSMNLQWSRRYRKFNQHEIDRTPNLIQKRYPYEAQNNMEITLKWYQYQDWYRNEKNAVGLKSIALLQPTEQPLPWSNCGPKWTFGVQPSEGQLQGTSFGGPQMDIWGRTSSSLCF